MSSPDKRARERKRLEKAREKARRREAKRHEAPRPLEVVTAEDVIGDVRSTAEVLADLDAPPESRAAAPIPARLFVGSLSDDTTSASLRRFFEARCAIDDAVVITDRGTGASRNFGFVTVADRKDAPGVIEDAHLAELDGARIVVRVATER